jgi:hypothetical protein
MISWSAAEVAEAAGALATQVAQLRGRGAAADPPAPVPTHGWLGVTPRGSRLLLGCAGCWMRASS